jgi:hypothetical protein
MLLMQPVGRKPHVVERYRLPKLPVSEGWRLLLQKHLKPNMCTSLVSKLPQLKKRRRCAKLLPLLKRRLTRCGRAEEAQVQNRMRLL